MIKRFLPVIAALALIASGCAGDDSANETANSTATTATTATTDGSVDAGTLKRYSKYTPQQYAGTNNWLCHPDADDLCDDDLDATQVNADGSTKVIPWTPAKNAPVDCFYVYPTISADPGSNSDLNPSPEQEGYAARNQVARLGEQCRVFAPVYRQVTLAGLTGKASPDAWDIAYDDILDAWKSYMAQANDGRGVVLIGHSQGAGMLKRLIEEEVDPNDDVRSHLVSAYLAGGSVAVPKGKLVGGEFKHIALCSKADEAGCVVTWSTFRSTAPPPDDAIFGRTTEAGMRAGCVSPAKLASGSTNLHGFFPADRSATILAGGQAGPPATPTVENSWVDPKVGVVDTPFVTLPGLTSGACASNDSADWLEITVNGDPADPRADNIGGDLSPQWGLHLVDISLVMGDIQTAVDSQTSAYTG